MLRNAEETDKQVRWEGMRWAEVAAPRVPRCVGSSWPPAPWSGRGAPMRGKKLEEAEEGS